MIDFNEYIKIAISLLVIINPLGNSPIFLSVTSDQNKSQQNKTARMTALSVAIILLITVFLGNGLLKFFGISISAFRVGAGILILLMSISMLRAQISGVKYIPEEAKEAEEKENVAVVPLGIPLLAGPGAISTVIIFTHQYSHWEHRLILCLIILGLSLLVWLTLKTATIIGKYLGKTGINIATRLMGLILSAVAIEFIVQGLLVIFPGLS